MMTNLSSRRIIEALRTGVPSHDAVAALGTGHPELEAAVADLFAGVKNGRHTAASGLVFNGDFGSGKSHLLEAFAASAIKDNFVVSRAVIGKNLAMHNSIHVLIDLMADTRTKTHDEDALRCIFNDAVDRGFDFAPLLRWSNEEAKAGRLAPLFPALLSALRRLSPEIAHYLTIIDYLAGAAIPATELNQLLRAHAPHIADRSAPRAAVRAPQTVRLLSRLFSELGFSGWIVLFDELELIRLQSPISRGKAYAEIAWWFGLDPLRRVPGLAAVGTVTSDFVRSCIEGGTFDLYSMAGRLGATVSNQPLAQPAVDGMNFMIEQQRHECSAPDVRQLTTVQRTIRGHYAAAFDATPSELKVDRPAGLSGISMRAWIRRWITMWDLERQGRLVTLDAYAVEPSFDDLMDDEP